MFNRPYAITLFIVLLSSYLVCCSTSSTKTPYRIDDKYSEVSLGDPILLVQCVDARNNLVKWDQSEFDFALFTVALKQSLDELHYAVNIYDGSQSMAITDASEVNIIQGLSSISDAPEIRWVLLPYLLSYKEDGFFRGVYGKVGLVLFDRHHKDIYWHFVYARKPLKTSDIHQFIYDISEEVKDDFLTN